MGQGRSLQTSPKSNSLTFQLKTWKFLFLSIISDQACGDEAITSNPARPKAAWLPVVCRIHLLHFFSASLSFDAFSAFEPFIFEGATYYLKRNKSLISTLQNAFKSPFVPSFLI